MGEMRDSDWSRPKLLRSDWLPPIGAIMTTEKVSKGRFLKSENGSKITVTKEKERRKRNSDEKERRRREKKQWLLS